MSEIKRFTTTGKEEPRMVESENGGWVDWFDYTALQEQLAEKDAEIARLTAALVHHLKRRACS